MECCAIVVAAGTGKRMGCDTAKQYLLLGDKPVLAFTLLRIASIDYIDGIVLVVGQNDISFCQREIIQQYKIGKILDIVAGGERRQDSVYNGLKVIRDRNPRYVLVHDGVRPFFSNTIFDDIFCAMKEHHAAIPGIPVIPTVKECSNDMFVERTIPRDRLWEIQTPQGFLYELLVTAYEQLYKKSLSVTDESMAMELLGHKIKLVKGNTENIKITTPADLEFARHLLDQWRICI